MEDSISMSTDPRRRRNKKHKHTLIQETMLLIGQDVVHYFTGLRKWLYMHNTEVEQTIPIFSRA